MLTYIGRRTVLAIFTVWAISVLAFVIIQLPPGDYVTSYIAQMASMGSVVSDEEAENLRIQYGLGQPVYVQYLKWMRLVVQGNFGMSMEWRRPVTEVIGREIPGVLPSGLVYWREGMLPMVVLTTRTPIDAGPMPITPMM